MVDRIYAGPGSLWRIAMMIILLWMAGCAPMGTTSGPPVQGEWRCDEIADAAVHQEQWDFALSRHQSLLEREPFNCLAIYHMGYIQGKLGDRRQETVQYEKAIQCGLNTDDRLYFNLGMAYGELDLMDEALSALEKAVSLNRQNAENFFGLGLVAKWAGHIHRAEAALNKAIDLDPRHLEARLLLTRIYLDEGRLDAARSHLQYLLEHAPDNEEAEALRKIYEDRRITAYE
jgi:tetratricopeptide (TPR) repeat protein